ncbi:MAG TPA: hypothetical protein EYP17_04760 [Candidatus Latescibacteria bacterium]|nr:hypothetical protein [Candidatus Latescibacterota bacterium]
MKLLISVLFLVLALAIPVLAGCAQLPQSLDPVELGKFLGQVFHYYSALIQSALGREAPSACQ